MPAAADILSDPIINQAYEDVRSDKSDTTWMVLKVPYPPMDAILPTHPLLLTSPMFPLTRTFSMPPLRLTTSPSHPLARVRFPK
jgi:hypothetical protein